MWQLRTPKNAPNWRFWRFYTSHFCADARLECRRAHRLAGVHSLGHVAERNSLPCKGYPFQPQSTDFSGLSAGSAVRSPCPDGGATPGGLGGLFSVIGEKGKHVKQVALAPVP